MLKLKISTIIVFILFITNNAISQGVAIKDGSSAPNSHAILDIDDSNNNKGILIPRVTTAERTDNSAGHFNLGASEEGLTVYDTDTKSYWLWDGTAWANFAGSGSGWGLTGNAGTTNGTDFLGTTDNQALDIRTNNVINLTIGTNGQIETKKAGTSVFVGDGVGTGVGRTVFVGYNAGASITTGNKHVGVGYNCLDACTTGWGNTAMGDYALSTVVSGDKNVAIGHEAFQKLKGDDNVAVGYNIGKDMSTSATFSKNTALGSQAFLYLKDASIENTAVGYRAWTGDDHFGVGYDNSTALGAYTQIDGDNQVHLGNTSIMEIQGQVNFGTYSDGRIKDNVKEDVKGVEFITKLRPVTYNINKKKQDKLMGITDRSKNPHKYDIEKITFSGFIAQEVDKAASDCNYNFSGVHKPSHKNDLYSLKYAEFVVPLVKATQEQQKTIENLQDTIKEMQKEIELLKNN